MKLVRRIYFYLMTLISVEVLIWGLIDLINNGIFRTPAAGSSNLAMGLSLVLVSLPIFLLHWSVIQRDSAREADEHASRLRMLFLYAVRMSTLVAAAQNALALLNRMLLAGMGLFPWSALVGGGETSLDNGVVIVINLIVWYYFERILQRDWMVGLPGQALAETRRLARYLWIFYSLGLTSLGVHQVISYILLQVSQGPRIDHSQLANALALVLVGAPVWVWCGKIVGQSLTWKERVHP